MGASRKNKGSKKKAEQWRSRATHAVDDPDLLGATVVQLRYLGSWEKNPSERIYLLDQEFGRNRLSYAVELVPSSWHPSFFIYVLKSEEAKALGIIKQLEEKNYGRSPQPQVIGEEPGPKERGNIQKIQPNGIPDHLKDEWEFAVYNAGFISSTNRALIFRNKANTIYGIREWNGPGAPWRLEKMAGRIVVDREFRQSLISDDPKIRELWEALGKKTYRFL